MYVTLKQIMTAKRLNEDKRRREPKDDLQRCIKLSVISTFNWHQCCDMRPFSLLKFTFRNLKYLFNCQFVEKWEETKMASDCWWVIFLKYIDDGCRCTKWGQINKKTIITLTDTSNNIHFTCDANIEPARCALRFSVNTTQPISIRYFYFWCKFDTEIGTNA